jgi:hypothetical protein
MPSRIVRRIVALASPAHRETVVGLSYLGW